MCQMKKLNWSKFAEKFSVWEWSQVPIIIYSYKTILFSFILQNIESHGFHLECFNTLSTHRNIQFIPKLWFSQFIREFICGVNSLPVCDFTDTFWMLWALKSKFWLFIKWLYDRIRFQAHTKLFYKIKIEYSLSLYTHCT